MTSFTLAVDILGLSTGFAKAENPMVGGAAPFGAKTIVESAVDLADHTTLVAVVQAAGFGVETLSGAGPFTIGRPCGWRFAPPAWAVTADATSFAPSGETPKVPER